MRHTRNPFCRKGAMHSTWLLLALGLLCGCMAGENVPSPDRLTLADGHSMLGRLDHADSERLWFQPADQPRQKIRWKNVVELRTTEVSVLLLKGSSAVFVGIVSLRSGDASLVTKNAVLSFPYGQIRYLARRSALNTSAAARPCFLCDLSGRLTAGGGWVTSNSGVAVGDVAATITQTVPAQVTETVPAKLRNGLSLSAAYGPVSHSRNTGSDLNLLHGEWESDQYLHSNVYLLEQLIFDRNSVQGLNLQQIYGGGIGYTGRHGRQTVELNLTLSYVAQNFRKNPQSAKSEDGSFLPNQHFFGPDFGASYLYVLPKQIVLFTSIYTSPSWSLRDLYSADSFAAISIPFSKRVGISFHATEGYIDNPAPLFRSNSLELGAGLTYSFR
jgi:hypothetical protein